MLALYELGANGPRLVASATLAEFSPSEQRACISVSQSGWLDLADFGHVGGAPLLGLRIGTSESCHGGNVELWLFRQEGHRLVRVFRRLVEVGYHQDLTEDETNAILIVTSDHTPAVELKVVEKREDSEGEYNPDGGEPPDPIVTRTEAQEVWDFSPTTDAFYRVSCVGACVSEDRLFRTAAGW